MAEPPHFLAGSKRTFSIPGGRHAGDGRRLSLEPARQLCQSLDWRSANGRLKEMSCRSALLQLQRRGLIKLPPPRRSVAWRGQSCGGGKRHKRHKRPIDKKESIKWLKSFAAAARLQRHLLRTEDGRLVQRFDPELDELQHLLLELLEVSPRAFNNL